MIILIIASLTSLVMNQSNMMLSVTTSVYNGTNCTAQTVCSANGLAFFQNYTAIYSFNTSSTNNLCINFYGNENTATIGEYSGIFLNVNVTNLTTFCQQVQAVAQVVVYNGFNCTQGNNITDQNGVNIPFNLYLPNVNPTLNVNVTEIVTCTTYASAERIFLNFILVALLSILVI